MMGQYKDRGVIRRLHLPTSPSSFHPATGRGRARTCCGRGSRHEARQPLGSELVIDAGLATVMTVHVAARFAWRRTSP